MTAFRHATGKWCYEFVYKKKRLCGYGFKNKRSALAEERNHKERLVKIKADITFDLPPELTFEADAGKISTVIESMLSNAVNYSKPPRKIRISYQSAPSDTMHRLAIQDNGIGITNTQLDEIFEPFQLPDFGTLNRKYDRIGLSLSIAKKYVQMHGGYISVDSILNLGSTFTIHLPKTRSVEVKAHDA